MTGEVLQILICVVGLALLFSMYRRERTLRSEIDQMKKLREQQLDQVSSLINEAQAAVLSSQDSAIANLRREMLGQIRSQQKVIWALVGILTCLVAAIVGTLWS